MRDLHVDAAGLGVNTIAKLILATRMGIVFDAILFADPGKEHKGTYEYIPIINKWLVENGQPEITVVRQVNIFGDFVGLYQHCLNNDMLPSIAYGHKSCSLKYKRAPQDKWCNNWEPAKITWENGFKVIKYIGYDADESHRTQKDFTDLKYNFRYILVENNMDRFDCIKLIIDEGLPLPPKSSCTFCPSMKPWEIIELYENEPKEFYDAIRMERNAMPNLTTVKGLGRDFSWWELIVAYRYFRFFKRNMVANISIPKRVTKLIKKLNRSIDGTKRAQIKIEAKTAKEITCELFRTNVNIPCECMD